MKKEDLLTMQEAADFVGEDLAMFAEMLDAMENEHRQCLEGTGAPLVHRVAGQILFDPDELARSKIRGEYLVRRFLDPEFSRPGPGHTAYEIQCHHCGYESSGWEQPRPSMCMTCGSLDFTLTE